jgi:hypothetical protein
MRGRVGDDTYLPMTHMGGGAGYLECDRVVIVSNIAEETHF